MFFLWKTVMTVNLLQVAYEMIFPPEYLFLSPLIRFCFNKSETFRNGKGRKIENKNVLQGRKCFRHSKKHPFESNNASPAQCLLPPSLLTEVNSSTRSVRFSCVCHFCLGFLDILSRLEKNSKPKKFICLVRIQFFTFLTKMFRRKPLIFRSKSRNKHETDYSSKAKHFSLQCSSRNVEYCCDKAVEIVLPISKRILINDQKKICNFSIKKKLFSPNFSSGHLYLTILAIFFSQNRNIFCQNSKLNWNILCFIWKKNFQNDPLDK